MTAPTLAPPLGDTRYLIVETLTAHQPELDYVPRHKEHRWYCGCGLAEGGKPYASQGEAYAGWVAHVAELADAALTEGAPQLPNTTPTAVAS